MIRLLIVAVVLAGVGAATWWYQRRSLADAGRGAHDLDPLPVQYRHGVATWLIFTTPVCASCKAVEAALRDAFPHHRVEKIDATEHPDLAARYDVRRAPTTLLADANGTIVERLVGPEAVRDFVGTSDLTITA
jgi:thiol-disulfide isomerase/thioredoxin